jgi:23S rRNA pseudouridine1911/1915/1917 synthase
MKKNLTEPEATPPLQILYEDNHLIVVSKPFRLPSQGDETGDISMFEQVKEYIRITYKKPGNVYLALLHRLDRVTGGVMVFGKTSKAAGRISEQFRKGAVKKVYYAVTEGIPDPPNGLLTHYVKQLPDKNIVRAYDKAISGAKFAELAYKVEQTNGNRALVRIMPHTGRKHQIRVQLASIGCPVAGDVKYGRIDHNPERYIALFACSISFEHPTTRELLTIETSIPDNWVWSEFQVE